MEINRDFHEYDEIPLTKRIHKIEEWNRELDNRMAELRQISAALKQQLKQRGEAL